MEFGFFQSGICKNLKWKITAPMVVVTGVLCLDVTMIEDTQIGINIFCLRFFHVKQKIVLNLKFIGTGHF